MRVTHADANESVAFTIPFHEISKSDASRVGGKNASLGEMIGNLTESGVAVPAGFAITVSAYRHFIGHNKLERLIRGQLARSGKSEEALAKAGQAIRAAIVAAVMPQDLEQDVRGEVVHRW